MREEAIFESVQGTFVGIDLGTSNSVVTYFKNNKFEQVKIKGKKIVPSALFYRGKDDIIFGEQALQRGIVNPEFLIKEFKRDLGTDTNYQINFIDTDNAITKPEAIFVIDTNIFINEPLILELFSKDEKIKLAETVISELTNLVNNDSVNTNATMALENIEKMKSELDISFEESHLELLSDDLTANTPNDDNDNRILSIAQYFNQDKIDCYLLTEDNGLKLKAETSSISVMKFSDFNSYQSKYEDSIAYETVSITPQEASRKLLQYLKEESEKSIGEDITNVVITVPANFNPKQITLIKDAGEDAGFDEVAIQKEPVAVGFAYAMNEEEDKTILVYDFGGGTFDASFLKISNGNIDVIETDGDNKLGGKDITEEVKNIILGKIDDEKSLDMFDKDSSNLSEVDFNKNIQMIERKAEEVKIELSDFETVNVDIANLIHSDGTTFNIVFTITRAEFDNAIGDIRKKSIDVINNIIDSSGIDIKDIDEIVMAGGTSSIPSIRESLIGQLGMEPKKSIDTSIVISQGASIEAIIRWYAGGIIIPPKVIDKALHDFGIGIKGLNFDTLIAKGSNLPISEKREYTTEKDNQETIFIKTFQRKSVHSDAKKTYDNGVDFVDEIIIEGLPPRKVGELTIGVTFELTKDDALDVTVEIIDSDGNIIEQRNKTTPKASK